MWGMDKCSLFFFGMGIKKNFFNFSPLDFAPLSKIHWLYMWGLFMDFLFCIIDLFT